MSGIYKLTETEGSSPLTRGAQPLLVVSDRSWRIIPAHAGSTPSWYPAQSAAADHPRSRGEHVLTDGWTRRVGGSSPLTRGARLDLVGLLHADGIIPAHAGSTSRTSRVAARRGDHPRSRGEHQDGRLRGSFRFGSSPLTRGARACGLVGGFEVGIIPAHAGSTHRSCRWAVGSADHPRSRGEHPRVQRRGCTPGRIIPAHAGSTRVVGEKGKRAPGSSPLTRGAPLAVAPGVSVLRIIPAHAGSTKPMPRSAKLSADHPRSRGEHESKTPLSRSPTGSSPLTRGAPMRGHGPSSKARDHPRSRGEHLGFAAEVDGADRIIPAHAGSTLSPGPSRRRKWDHPRSRGEHLTFCCRSGLGLGSSPLTRGAPVVASTRSISRSDHPRSRGEHCWMRSESLICRGSSPLTRGARPLGDRLTTAMRIIPAHAGSTPSTTTTTSTDGDHPRSRGEHVGTTGAMSTSSRIIPAHAGSTLSDLGKLYRHPPSGMNCKHVLGESSVIRRRLFTSRRLNLHPCRPP